jgi:hypothetical protein
MINFPKMAHFHCKLSKWFFFSWKIFTYGNNTVASMKKIPMYSIYGTCFPMLWTKLPCRLLVNFPPRSKYIYFHDHFSQCSPCFENNTVSNILWIAGKQNPSQLFTSVLIGSFYFMPFCCLFIAKKLHSNPSQRQ